MACSYFILPVTETKRWILLYVQIEREVVYITDEGDFRLFLRKGRLSYFIRHPMRLRRGRCVATLRYHWALRPSSAQRQYGCALVQTLNACRSPGSALPYILQRHRFYDSWGREESSLNIFSRKLSPKYPVFIIIVILTMK